MTAKKSLLAALAVVILIVITGYCTVKVDASCFHTDSISRTSETVFWGEQLSSDSSIENVYAASQNIFRSKFSFTQMGLEKRSSKEEYRTYFFSVLAVLVKTAMIPEYILITVIGAGYLRADVLRQRMSFIHNKDGKKERGAFLPV